MHLCIFLSTLDASLRRSAIFGLALYSAALLGVCWRDGFSSHTFPYIYHNWISNHWVFKFIKVYYNNLDICLRWILRRVRSVHSIEISVMVLRGLFCL